MVKTTDREENSEFCVAVAPATRTADILTLLNSASYPAGLGHILA